MTADKISLDWMISVDDHVLEPGRVWLDRLPAKYHDIAPQIERGTTGEFWTYEDKRLPTAGLSAVAGKSKEEFSPEPVGYDDMRP
ncbi:MAG: amidohydrolase, partial [Acidimicrobiia bacterium]